MDARSKQAAAVVLIAVLCLTTALAWARAWWIDTSWRIRYSSEASHVGYILNQYTADWRDRGQWPAAETIYAEDAFRLHTSTRVGDARVDTYRTLRGTFLRIELKPGGDLSLRVLWAEEPTAGQRD